jgi:outer membrane protein assembly factor BamB
MLLPGLAIAHVTAQSSDSSDVPMFHGNPARTGELPGPGPDPDEPIVTHWSFETDSVINASPAVADGVVYISSTDGNLYAIDAATGQPNWVSEIGWSESSPAIADGVVYVGGSRNTLFAIDAATGEHIWEAIGDRFDGIVSSPVVVDGVVYIGSDADGTMYALDAATGKEKWSVDLGWIDSSPAVVDGVVYVIQKSLSLYALDAETGEELWMFEAGNLVFSYRTSPAVAGDTVYAYSNYNQNLYAVDIASGEARWEYQIPITDAAFNSMNASPAVANGTVYLGGSDALYAIDAETGEQHWSFPVDRMLDSSPVVVDGIVYAGSSNAFYAIDAETGKEAWSFPSDSKIYATPAIVDGVIYLAFGSRLVAFGNPTPEMRTATAEAQATATAQANEYATAAAVAGITATAQAHIEATTTAVAGQTATAEAQAFATSEAIQLSWQNYFWTDIEGALSAELAELPGVSIETEGHLTSGSDNYLPDGYSRVAIYPIQIAGGSASALVSLLIFPSKDDADTAMETMTGGLIRSGWETQKVKGLDHDHTCLTIEQTSWSEAICYMTRDDALIVSSSGVSLPNADAALLNAVDLTNAMNDAYNEVDRPDGT